MSQLWHRGGAATLTEQLGPSRSEIGLPLEPLEVVALEPLVAIAPCCGLRVVGCGGRAHGRPNVLTPLTMPWKSTRQGKANENNKNRGSPFFVSRLLSSLDESTVARGGGNPDRAVGTLAERNRLALGAIGGGDVGAIGGDRAVLRVEGCGLRVEG